MAKRKNPLKDLDAFLKQDASSFVKPEKKEPPPSAQATVATEQPAFATTDEIITAIDQLAKKDQKQFREDFFEIIKSSLEHLDPQSAEDKMLINTILYLKDKDNWKENISSYWEKHS